MTEDHFSAASALLSRCNAVIDAGTPVGSFNQMNARLLAFAQDQGIPVFQGWRQLLNRH